MDKANEALKLWQEWFEKDGSPLCADSYGDPCCFFCAAHNPTVNGHMEDCLYLRAKTLIKGPLFEGLGPK